MTADWVRLDGSEGEGGGQILRSSLALSILTGRPFEITQVRARREKPGLRPQHLEAVRAARKICGGEVEGDYGGSSRLVFIPGAVQAGDYEFVIPTAGSAPLVLHTVSLPLALQATPSSVVITGGTHLEHAPCYHYLAECWQPALGRLGLQIDLRLVRCGFYPRGGGKIEAEILPASPANDFTWMERGAIRQITPISLVARLPVSIAERQAQQASQRLRATAWRKMLAEPVIEEHGAVGPGTMLGLRCEFATGQMFCFALGARGKRAETVADEAVDELLAYLAANDCPVDPHLADQLLLPAATHGRGSTYRTSQVTLHLLTNALVLRRFLERSITIDGDEGMPGTVTVAAGW